MASTLHILAVLVAAVVLLVLRKRSRDAVKYANLPPGPAPELFFGNSRQIAPQYPWRQWYELSKIHGPVMTLWMGSQPTIILNDVRSVTELLQKNARDTSDRPRSIVGDEILSGNKRILLVGHTDRWRKLRKALHTQLQPQEAKLYEPAQEKAAKQVIADILSHPASALESVDVYGAAIALRIGYGREDKLTTDDKTLAKITQGQARLGSVLRPGSYKVESLPWLRYVPGYLDVPKQWHKEELELFSTELQAAQKRLAAGKLGPCFSSFVTERQQELELSDDECAYLAGSIFGAGSDTSASAIKIAIMVAATHVDVQRRVQEQLDRVVGSSPPTFNDLADLPLVKAFVHETFRWRPVSSGGFAHKTTAELQYDGYTIPAGTTLIGNHWGVHRDADYYPEPEDFDLDRWVQPDGQLTDLKHFQYGFGMRVCPGQHVANRSVYINTAMLLWAFDIRQKSDEPIDTLAFTNTANSHPLPFKATFTPRRKDLDVLIR